ncbi:endonuclease exonuclease phosphatase family protein [Babesia ovis]|uniref:Endonuclease exonuclease phosphatase family protein n=1 Tax=Babesia ovis TaxID=5869 RepID=A0A9W5WUA8_BABOV|nr:endonuclease exonuclease phosphatase family protein [Babesia ovis]
MESDAVTHKSYRIKPDSNGYNRGGSKLYDPRKGSAYARLSKTHELKLKQYEEQKNGFRLATPFPVCVNGSNSNSFCDVGTISFGDSSDAWMHESSMELQTYGSHGSVKSVTRGRNQLLYTTSTSIGSAAGLKELQPTVSLPVRWDNSGTEEAETQEKELRAVSYRETTPFERRIQVPYLNEFRDPVKVRKRPTERWECGVAQTPKAKQPILIESFRNSKLPSFRASKDLTQSFSMLTFNAGLLEVRMLGLQMYQNPGYTEKRLKCVPSEIRKANADVVAFQEVYSNYHAQYIMRELKDLYPYSVRDECTPVSEDFEHLYDKSMKNKKRGIGMFHSGLLFLSKFPILCAKFHAWNVVTHLEALLANKGYLEIFVNIPAIGKVAFYNIHMASASVNPESTHVENVRNEEIKQLLKTTERACRLGFAPIIIGDLNAAPNNCASNYMSFIHGGWTDAYVLSRQKTKTRKAMERRGRLLQKRSTSTMSSPSFKESIGVENVFGDNKSQKPQLEKVTVMSNVPRSRSGEFLKTTNWSVMERSAWSRFMRRFRLHRNERHRRDDTTWQCVKAYYPHGDSLSLRVIQYHSLDKRRTRRSKKMDKLQKHMQKNKLRVSVKAPCLENREGKTAKTFKERCTELLRKSKSFWTAEHKAASHSTPMPSTRIRFGLNPNEVYFLVRNPSMKLKAPRVRRFYWWSRRRNFMDVTWDPRNPLNMHGPHAGCSGLRCDYIFLPPQPIAGILHSFTPSAGEILFREPIVMIDKVGSAYNCLCSTFTSMKKVMLVTLSDHYGLKITMVRKNVVRKDGLESSMPRHCRSI